MPCTRNLKKVLRWELVCSMPLGPQLGGLLGWVTCQLGLEASGGIFSHLPAVGAAQRGGLSTCGSFVWPGLPPHMVALRPLDFFTRFELLTWRCRVLGIVFQRTRRGCMALITWPGKLKSRLLHFICYQWWVTEIGLCSRWGNKDALLNERSVVEFVTCFPSHPIWHLSPQDSLKSARKGSKSEPWGTPTFGDL